MEALISSQSPHFVFNITHASDVAAVRRAGQKLADALGFNETRAGQLALIITEVATNLLKHAGEGVIHVGSAQSPAGVGVDVLALDKGPGIADLDNCLRDGVSSTGTAGTGLGALQRLSDEFDVYTVRDEGTVFFMRLWRDVPAPLACGVEVGALWRPIAGEDECGDGWAVLCGDDGATVLASDGLGHGPNAAAASNAAIDALALRGPLGAGEMVHAAHEALRGSRGAALAAARIDFANDELRFAGVGNIGGIVIDDDRRALVSHNGIVGANMRKVQEFSVPFPVGALCILYSDGIHTQWDLTKYPGLQSRAPALIAAVLMRDFIRGRDDAMAVVVRRLAGAG